MTTQFDVPSKGAVAFVFEDAFTPEGYYRVTLWRALTPSQGFTGIGGGSIKNPTQQPTLYVKLRQHLLTTLPITEIETENYFTQATTRGFDLGIYNTNSLSDILQTAGNANIAPLTFDNFSDGRLIFKYIKPTETTDLYAKVEFLPDGETVWQLMDVGQAQNAIGGDDHRWIHADQSNPYLDERANCPLDAEQIFNFRFVHVAQSAIAKAPVKPTTKLNDSSSWYMPFYSPVEDPTNSANPYAVESATGRIIIQGVDSAIFRDDSGNPQYARYNRHIPAGLWLTNLFNYCFGVGKWTFVCEDSPILQKRQIANQTYSSPSGPFTISVTEGDYRTVNASPTAPIQKWILLPQCLWGLYDKLNVNNGVPLPDTTFASTHKSAWDSVLEFCLENGWIPTVDLDGNGNALITFKDRSIANLTVFSTIVPVTAKPTAFPESENGISVFFQKSFLNAETDDGWYEDWYASKINPGSDLTAATNAFKRQANPYIVPAVAAKPATLNTTICCGGNRAGFWVDTPTSEHNIGWYSTSTVGYSGGSGPFPRVDVRKTENFPMLTPAVYGTPSVLPQPEPLFSTLHVFSAVVRAGFNYITSDGAKVFLECDSLRQALSRFYSFFFVKSDREYECEYDTINKFFLLDANGSITGKPSWKNCAIFNQTALPDGHRYYVKRIVRDPNQMKTTALMLRTVPYNLNFESGIFQDDTEKTGKLAGPPPNTPPPNNPV